MTDHTEQPGANDDGDLVPAVPLKEAESWLAREERIDRERRERAAAERTANEHRTDAAIARMRALATNNGEGFCRACGIKFTVDGEGRAEHPKNECAGPKPPPCSECGREPELRMRGGFKTWELVCGPSDHAATRGAQNPGVDITLAELRRVGRDDEDDDEL